MVIIRRFSKEKTTRVFCWILELKWSLAQNSDVSFELLLEMKRARWCRKNLHFIIKITPRKASKVITISTCTCTRKMATSNVITLIVIVTIDLLSLVSDALMKSTAAIKCSLEIAISFFSLIYQHSHCMRNAINSIWNARRVKRACFFTAFLSP